MKILILKVVIRLVSLAWEKDFISTIKLLELSKKLNRRVSELEQERGGF